MVTVVTAADVPVNEYGLTMFDQPVLIGPASPVSEAGRARHGGKRPCRQTAQSTARRLVPGDVSRWEADHLAVVVAETERQAEAEAALLLATEVGDSCPWSPTSTPPLPPTLPVLTRRQSGPRVHRRPGRNAYHHYVIRKGDAAAAHGRGRR